MMRTTATNLVLGVLLWGVGLCAPTGNLNASEPSMTGDEATSGAVTKNVKQLVGGQEYKGVLEISHRGIAYVNEYAEWLEFTPWNQVLGWKGFGSKHAGPNEENLCTLWIQVEKGSPHASRHLFFKITCDIIPGQENWETLESYDPRGHF